MVRILLLAALCIGAGHASGQWSTSGTWTSFGVDQTLSPRLSCSLTGEARLDLTAPQLDAVLFEGALQREWGRWDLSTSCRVDGAPGDALLTTRGTLRIATSLPLPSGGKLTARVGYQRSSSGTVWGEGAAADLAREAVRLRLGAVGARRPAGWRPGISAECFGRPVDVAPGTVRWGLTDLRLRADLDFDLPSRMALTTGYQFERPFYSADPHRVHTLRLVLTLSRPQPQPRSQPQPQPRPQPQPSRVLDRSGRPWPGGEVEGVQPCTAEAVRLGAAHTAGEPVDWVLLVNDGDVPCSLEGARLDDGPELADLTFGSVVVPAGGMWWGFREGEGGFSSGLSTEGEVLHLAYPDGTVRTWVLRANPEGLPEGFDRAGSGVWLPAGWQPSAGLPQ
jgi:hypothetical protein